MKKNNEGIIIENELSFSADEANSLIQIINIAIKAEGINVAKAGVHFQEKLQGAFTPQPAQAPEVKPKVTKAKKGGTKKLTKV